MSDFFSGGNKSISFGSVGDRSMFGKAMGGPIISVSEEHQATNMQDGTPKTWKKTGDPVMQVIVSLDTRNGKFPQNTPPIDGDDDGTRDLYLEKGSQKFKAVVKAMREAHVKSLDPGSELYIAWTGDEPAKTAGFNDKRLCTAQYIKHDAPAQFFQGEPEQAPAAATQQAAPQSFPSQPATPPQAPAANPFGGAPQAPAQAAPAVPQQAPNPFG